MIINLFRSIVQANFLYNLASAQLTANTLTTSPDTMIRGWPDFIRCGDSRESGHSFALHNAANTIAWYYQVYFGESRWVEFDANGGYFNKRGPDVTTLGCLGQSITQLYQSGRAFNLVTSRSPDASGNSTILKGFPDAIRCGVGASGGIVPSGAIFFLSYYDSSLVVYTQVYRDQDRSVNFDGNGYYISKTGDDNSSRGCLGQSISQLYASGRAFNLVTSKTIDNTGTNSMVAGWPDAIQCIGSTKSHIFLFHGSVTGGSGGYVQAYAPENRLVSFDGNGKFLRSEGNLGYAIGDCATKTIKELEAAGRIYNFVTSRTQNTPPTCKDFSLTLKPTDSGALNFAPVINDYEQGITNLKIKIYVLPACTIITTTNGASVVVGSNQDANQDTSIAINENDIPIDAVVVSSSYAQNALFFKACNKATTESLTYSVIDSGNLESARCNLNFLSAPICNDFTLTLKSSDAGALSFSGNISGSASILKVKIYALPACTSITTTNGPVAPGSSYAQNALFFKACNIVTTESLTYSVIDSGDLESARCNLNFLSAPICNDFALTLKSSDSGSLSFSGKISGSASSLKVKIYALPTCTLITTINSASVVAGSSYAQNALFFKACNTATQDILSYSVTDGGSLESLKCNVNFVSTPNFCLTFKLDARTLSPSCTINNFYYNKYLTTDCSQSKTSYFDIAQNQDGYFLLTANQEELSITKVSSNLFLLKHLSTDSYLSLEDGQNTSYLKTATNKSYWKIQGTCNFLNNKLYNKFSIEQIQDSPACNAKITLDKVSLVTKTFAASGTDFVTIGLSCGNIFSQFSEVFSANSAVKKFTGSITCDGANDRLDISIAANNNQRFTFQVPKGTYSKYPDNLHVSYSASEQDLNSGEVTIVSFAGNVSATCSASFSALSQLNASGKIDAGCEAIVNGSGRADMPWPLSDAKISMTLKATCSAYLNASAAAKATFNFQAQCAADLNASGSIVVKNICASLDNSSSMGMKGAANLLSMFNSEINADGYLQSNTNACMFINNIAKYLIDVTYSYDNQPFCFVPNDFLFLSGKTLELSHIASDAKINNIQIKSALFTQSYIFSAYYPKSQVQNLKIPCIDSAQIIILDAKNSTTIKSLPCANNSNLTISKATINLQAQDVDQFYSLIQDKSSPALFPESATSQDFTLQASCTNDILGYIARIFLPWETQVCTIDMNFDAPYVYNAYKIRFMSEASKGHIVQKSTWLFKDVQKSPDLFGNKHDYSPNDLRYEADLFFHNLQAGFNDEIKYVVIDSSGYESPEAIINFSFTQDATNLNHCLWSATIIGLMLFEVELS